MSEYTPEEIALRYRDLGMCKRCGERPHMRVFTVCRQCRYSDPEIVARPTPATGAS